MPWSHVGTWMYRSIILDLGTRRRWVICFTAPAALPPVEQVPVPIGLEIVWAPESIWTLWNRDKSWPSLPVYTEQYGRTEKDGYKNLRSRNEFTLCRCDTYIRIKNWRIVWQICRYFTRTCWNNRKSWHPYLMVSNFLRNLATGSESIQHIFSKE
jgi:hypothetical protein